MSQKKKKPNAHQLQKLAGAQYKKEFFVKFRELFNIFCNKELYQQIPHSKLEEIYSIRSHSMRPVAAIDNHIPVSLLNNLKSDITLFLKNEILTLELNETKISLYDFLTVGLTLIRFGLMIRENEFEGSDTIIESLKKFRIVGEFDLLVRTKISRILDSTAIWYNDIGKCLYWLKYDIIGFNNPNTGIQHLAYVYTHIPQSSSVEIHGKNKLVILLERVLPQTGPNAISIIPTIFNRNSPFAKIPMKVYIQNHAIMRLAERIDSINIGLAQFFMCRSFDEPKVFYDNHQNLLIEYRIFDIKAGYFRVDMVDGIILVRTFLFITNNGTPEGQLLEKNTGLQKLDKKYLSIDKLSTFMSSDIGDKKELQKIIDESGCHCLIELYKRIKKTIIKEGNHLSDELLISYLKKDNTFEIDDMVLNNQTPIYTDTIK